MSMTDGIHQHGENVFTGSPSNIRVIENFISLESCKSILNLLESSSWRRGTFNWACHPYEQEDPKAFPDLETAVLQIASYMFGANLSKHSHSYVKWTAKDKLRLHTDAENFDCTIQYDDAYNDTSAATILYTTLIYFNDDYSGGELCFPHHEIRLKPASGTLVMFPSTCMYPHEVLPILKGERYTFSMFCSSKSLINMFADMKEKLKNGK